MKTCDTVTALTMVYTRNGPRLESDWQLAPSRKEMKNKNYVSGSYLFLSSQPARIFCAKDFVYVLQNNHTLTILSASESCNVTVQVGISVMCILDIEAEISLLTALYVEKSN